MIPKPRKRLERVPAPLGPMKGGQMPRKLHRPAEESPFAGLARFMRRHFADPTPVRKAAP